MYRFESCKIVFLSGHMFRDTFAVGCIT